jgi:predicted ATPase/DNA-binding winged helix-turn-helix (wHTH) protein
MSAPRRLRSFGPFSLDIADEQLRNGSGQVAIGRKPLALLLYLSANPRRVVTREELVQAAWGNIAVSESLVRTHVRQLRVVLGEGFIETVLGRGYRFLPRVKEVDHREMGQAEGVQPASAFDVALPPIGRAEELAVLDMLLDGALQGRRQIVFVSGEAGIGKTALVDAFIAKTAERHRVIVAHGSSIEQLGTAEAYFPVFCALESACRAEGGERVVEILARHAPMWLAQMPGSVADDRLATLRLRTHGATQMRMLRELADALDTIAGESPVVLVLEDLQWSDHATMDLIAMLGRRRGPARILVIATYRGADLSRGDPLAKVVADLTTHKQASVVALEALSEASIVEYLAKRFSPHAFPDDLATTIHRLTGGNPLFTVAFVNDLKSDQLVSSIEGTWRLASSLATVAALRPETVRQFIDIQIDRLTPSVQRSFEAASLVGTTFAVGTVAHALGMPAEEVNASLEELARRGRFIRSVQVDSRVDGSVQPTYAFVNELYRHAAQSRNLGATWQGRIA